MSGVSHWIFLKMDKSVSGKNLPTTMTVTQHDPTTLFEFRLLIKTL